MSINQPPKARSAPPGSPFDSPDGETPPANQPFAQEKSRDARPFAPPHAASPRRCRHRNPSPPRLSPYPPLAIALHLALLGGAFGLVGGLADAHAQTAPAATSQAASRSYDIPAGPLNAALSRFAGEAGVLLAGNAGLVEGKSSSGLKGSYSVQAGFAALLAGTGLEAFRQGDGSYGLRAAPVVGRGGEVRLAPVTVTGSAGYLHAVKIDQASVTRSGASILDTPQTVNVIPVQTAQDQAAQTIGDVVRNTAGARPQSYFGTYESVYARGFWMTTTSNWTRNGFRWVHLSQPSKRNVDRYELIKGPVGLDYGRVEPGALMNIVTKKPLETTYRELTAGVSQGDGWDLGFDLTGPLNEAGKVLYRLNGGKSRQAFVADEVNPRQDDLAGALTFKLSSDTTLDLDFEWTERNQRIYPGLPLPDPTDPRSTDRVPLSNFYGEPAGTFKGWHRAITAQLEHRFNDEWSGRVGYAKNVMFRDVKQVRITGVSGDTVNRAANPFSQEFDVDTVVGELKGDVRLAGMRHRLTLTVDRVGLERTGSSNNFGNVAPISLTNPQPSGATFTYGPKSTSKVTDTGYAVQDYIEITPRWNALVGVRHSEYREENPGRADQKGSSTDPTIALIFKPEPWASLYASYARSFRPNSGTLTGPDTYAPRHGEIRSSWA